MATVALTIIQDIKILLHDPNGTNYTTQKLLPHLDRAYKSLQLKMRLAGLQSGKEVSSDISLDAGQDRLGDGAGLPNDFIAPIAVYIKESGYYRRLTEYPWETIDNSTTAISIYGWAHREDEIKFRPASTDQIVRLRYIKSLSRIDEESDPILIPDSELYLSAKGAAYAALFIGENPSRAQILDNEASTHWIDFRGMAVKQQQRLPVRRRVNRFRR
jgi:hypothetical protein